MRPATNVPVEVTGTVTTAVFRMLPPISPFSFCSSVMPLPRLGMSVISAEGAIGPTPKVFLMSR